jgi:RHS repeat-associated protein
MVELLQFLLVVSALLLSLAGIGYGEDWMPIAWLRRMAAKQHLAACVVGAITLLGRMVETAVGTTYTEIVYSPLGKKFAVMSGQKLQKGFVPLATGAKAIYTSSGLTYYRHHDHLGSSRLATTPSKTLYSSTAYAPFGEPYKQAGTTDLSFTGQDQDTASGMHDFPDRRYMPVQGRWLTPDPAGLKAVSLANPQTWNRYAYVNNNPLALVDPFGDDDGCYSMGDASCEGQYYGGEDGWPSVSPPGINPTNGSIQNTNNTTPWDTPGTPGEFDVLDAELLLGITPGTPAALDALQNALNDAWGHGQDPGSNLQLLLTVSDALAGYLDVPDGFLINGLGEATQVEQNCANAAKAILTWIQQNGPGSPPSILLSGTATCAANAGSQLSPN